MQELGARERPGERGTLAMSVIRDAISKSEIKTRTFLSEGINFLSPRSFTISVVLVLTMISTFYFLQLGDYLGMDVAASMLYQPNDCWPDAEWAGRIGRHCFNDYVLSMTQAMQSNPWGYAPPANYPASGMLIFWLFGHIGLWFGDRTGLLAYLLCLTVSVLTPAVWAARASQGWEKIVIFMVCGAVALPAWTVIDRGNSIGFAVPIMLTYLVALTRERWRTVATMVVLATMIKPQFALLGMVLLSYRQWWISFQTAVGVAITNTLAYLFWPAHFPQTIVKSIQAMLNFGSSAPGGFASTPLNRYNVSFAKGLFLIPDALAAKKNHGVLPGDYLQNARTVASLGIVLLIILAIAILGRRVAPLMTGITLLASASLFIPLTSRYYLLFCIPIAALIIRDPQGPPSTGTFDGPTKHHRIAVFLMSFSTAATIAQIPLPLPVAVTAFTQDHNTYPLPGAGPEYVESTAAITPLLWLATCVAILASYVRLGGAPIPRHEDGVTMDAAKHPPA